MRGCTRGCRPSEHCRRFTGEREGGVRGGGGVKETKMVFEFCCEWYFTIYWKMLIYTPRNHVLVCVYCATHLVLKIVQWVLTIEIKTPIFLPIIRRQLTKPIRYLSSFTLKGHRKDVQELTFRAQPSSQSL